MGLEELGKIESINGAIIDIFKLRYSQLLVITDRKIAMVCGKSYDVYGDFIPVVHSTTDLNRNFAKTDKILECSICNKEFLLVKYQPGG